MTLSAGLSSFSPIRCCPHDSQPLSQRVYQTYAEVADIGLSSWSLDFPTPRLKRAHFVETSVMDHKNGRIHVVGVVCSVSETNRSAYVVKRKIARTKNGGVHLCTVLRRRMARYDTCGVSPVDWISTDEMVALKVSRLATNAHHDQIHQKCVTEAGCLQYIGNYHENILGCIEVLLDDTYLYVVMPFCTDGTLLSVIRGAEKLKRPLLCKSNNSGRSFRSESPPHSRMMYGQGVSQSRIWFQQLLQSLLHLQKKGVCHRNISPENLLLESHSNNLILVDFGSALRVPYTDDANFGGLADVSEGTSRLLIRSEGKSGCLAYTAPEILEDYAFDGFTADLWSAGVVLFVLLVGTPPFKLPNSSDPLFRQINRGKLRELVVSLKRDISAEACDLLQNMLWRDPRRRLSLYQVLEHPWVTRSEQASCGSGSRTQSMTSDSSPRAVSPQPESLCYI